MSSDGNLNHPTDFEEVIGLSAPTEDADLVRVLSLGMRPN